MFNVYIIYFELLIPYTVRGTLLMIKTEEKVSFKDVSLKINVDL